MSANVDQDDWDTEDIIIQHKPSNLLPNANSFQPRPASNVHLNMSSAGPSILTRPSSSVSVSASGAVAKGKDTCGGDEDDWFRGGKPANNREIWDSANSRGPTPQIIAPQVLPQPKMQLLRRSPGDSGQGAPSSGTADKDLKPKAKTLEEREEEYRLARERIFGASAGAGAGAGSSGGASPSSEATAGASRQQISSGNRRSNGGRKRDDHASNEYRFQPTPPPNPPMSSRTTPTTSSSTGSPFQGIIPNQVRSVSRPPSGTRPNYPTGVNGMPGGNSGGVVRQPSGPGQGAGFSGSGFASPYMAPGAGYASAPAPTFNTGLAPGTAPSGYPGGPTNTYEYGYPAEYPPGAGSGGYRTGANNINNNGGYRAGNVSGGGYMGEIGYGGGYLGGIGRGPGGA